MNERVMLPWQQLQLNIHDGGIGIGITDHQRFVSYLSSFVHCSTSIFSHHTRITPGFSYDDLIIHHSPALYDDFCDRIRLLPTPDASTSSLLAIRTWQLHYNRTFMNTHNILNSVYYCIYHINKPNINITNLFATEINNNKLQHELSTYMYSTFFTNFMNLVSSSNDLGFIAHIGSIQNEDSGRWIALSPKFPNYVMTSSEIRISLLRRCFLAQPSITTGLHCNCSAQPLLDIQGRHFTTGCCKGSHRIECHDNLKNTINSICRYSGCSTRVEERNCFSNINTHVDNANNNINTHDDGDGRRPDLSVSNFKNGNNKDLLLDICVTQSYPGSKKCFLPPTFTRAQANLVKVSHTSATEAYNHKMQKYLRVASENNYMFQPIVIEANGYIHPQSLKCFQEFASLSSTRFNRSESAVLSYFRNQISITLQTSLAKSIQKHSAEIINPATRRSQYHIEEYRIASNFIYSDRGRKRRA